MHRFKTFAHFFSSKVFLIILGSIILLSLVVFGAYKIMALQSEVKKMKDSPKASQEALKEETLKLTAKVASLIAVPEGETPTVATVTDPERLKASPFFINAKLGDKVLIYTSAKKAVLYRPDEQKIIEVGPISIGTPSATTATPATKILNIVLYNGTTKTGLTKAYENIVKSKTTNTTIVDRDNAKKTDYEKTIVILINQAVEARAKELAKLLGAEVAPLPTGETAPKNADILVIVGADAIK